MSRELNLLPPSRRRLVDQQITLNVVVHLVNHVLMALAVLTVSGLAILIGLRLMIWFSGSASSHDLKEEIKKYQDQREEIARQNSSLKLLYDLATGPIIWSEHMPELLGTLPPGTIITEISGDQRKDLQLIISGQATSRTSLLALTERLRKLSWVQGVAAPESNLIDRVSPSYQFTIRLNKPAAPLKP